MRLPFKQLHEIFEPDPRSKCLARLDAAGQHQKTIEDHYGDITAIRLSKGVPAEIREQFDTIRNLYLYSWYVYDFTIAVDLYVYALIEKAIREKCQRSGLTLQGHEGLKRLLKISIQEGWITNTDFDYAVELMDMEIISAANNTEEPPKIRLTPRYCPTGTDFFENLIETLPKIRNIGAHGEAGLGLPSSALHSVETCACIANALFSDHGYIPEFNGDPVTSA